MLLPIIVFASRRRRHLRHRDHDPPAQGRATRRSPSARSSPSPAGCAGRRPRRSSTRYLGFFAPRAEPCAAASASGSPAASPAARAPSRTCLPRWACPSSTPICWRAKSSRPARRCCARSPSISAPQVLQQDGSLDRHELRERVFADPARTTVAGSAHASGHPRAHRRALRSGHRALRHRRDSAAGGNRRRGALRSRAGRRLRARSCSSHACMARDGITREAGAAHARCAGAARSSASRWPTT